MLVLDCDGVLTDGAIIYDDQGHELKHFSVRDGLGLRVWQRSGFTAAIITGRGGKALQRRASELGIEHLVEGVSDKNTALTELCESVGIPLDECAVMGDDWPDLAMFDLALYSIAPHDAHSDLRSRAHYVTPSCAGHGAVREAVEHLLAAQGLLQQARDTARTGRPG